MNKRLNLCLLISVANGSVPAAMADDTSLEEIVITASKRGATSLQDTAISVSAITADTLEASRIMNTQDLQYLVPNLVIGESNASPGDGVVRIRGIGAQVLSAGNDPSSTVHLDGVYNPRPSAVLAEFLDVERVEVLRGPQGTLYGRNSVGGTINVISKMPTPETEISLNVEAGNYGSNRIWGTANGTLVEDKLLGRIALSRRATDGYLKNLVNGKDFGEEDVFAARGALAWTLSDSVNLVLRFDHTDSDGDGDPMKNIGIGADPADAADATLPPINALPDGGFYDVTVDADNNREQKDSGFSAELTWETDHLTLKSLTGYRKHSADIINDLDATSAPIAVDTILVDSKQFSQEIQLTSRNEGRINWLAAAFYLQEDSELYVTSDFNPNQTIAGGSFFGLGEDQAILVADQDNQTDVYALFGELYVDLTDQLKFTLGLRYSNEEKTMHDGTVVPFVYVPAGDMPVFNLDSLKVSESWDDWTPKATLEYTPSETVMLYATYSEGFKSGGFNLRFGSPDADPFDPESVKSYEVGSKMTFFDERLRTNLSIFHADYTDQQIQVAFTNPNTGLTEVQTRNAGESRYRGMELETQAIPFENALVSLSVAWLDGEFEEFNTLSTGDLDGFTTPDSPEWSIALLGRYSYPIENLGELTFQADYLWRDDNTQRPNALVENQHVIDSYSLLNARMTLEADSGWYLSIWGKNLTNEEYVHTEWEGSFAVARQYIAPPRTYGVTAGIAF